MGSSPRIKFPGYLIGIILLCVVSFINAKENSLAYTSIGSVEQLHPTPRETGRVEVERTCPDTPTIIVNTADCPVRKGKTSSPQYLVQNGDKKDRDKIPTDCGAFEISCRAWKPITWIYHGPKVQDLEKVIRTPKILRTSSEPWNDTVNGCFQINFTMVVSQKHIVGRYSCVFTESSNATTETSLFPTSKKTRQRFKSRLYIFWTEAEKTTLIKNMINGSNGLGPTEIIIPCKSNEANASVELAKKDLKQGVFRIITTQDYNFTYDASKGFLITPSSFMHDDTPGTYKCLYEMPVHETQTEFFVNSKFEVEGKSEKTDDLVIQLNKWSSCEYFTCSSKTGETIPARLKIIGCENPVHCNLLWEPTYSFLSAMRPYSSDVDHVCDPTKTMIEIKAGLVVCSTENGSKYQVAEYYTIDDPDSDDSEEVKGLVVVNHTKVYEKLSLTTDLFERDGDEEYTCVGQNVKISCKAPQYLFADNIQLVVKYQNGSMASVLSNDSVLKRTSKNGYFEYKWSLTASSTHIRNYVCMAPLLLSREWRSISTKDVRIINGSPPIILTNHIKSTPPKVTFNRTAENISISCVAYGVPRPYFQWYDPDGNEFSLSYKTMWMARDKVSYQNVTVSYLKIPSIKKLGADLPGRWTCKAHNVLNPPATYSIDIEFAEDISNAYNVSLPDNVSQPMSWVPIIVVTFVSVIAVIILIVQKKTMDRRIKKLKNMSKLSMDKFLRGDPKILELIKNSAEINGHKLARAIRYEKEKYEIVNPDDVDKGDYPDSSAILGAGYFGLVVRGTFRQPDGQRIPVAIKMPKKTPDYDQTEVLQDELKRLAYVGEHQHVIRLIGAITADIAYGKIQVLLEYCETSLEQFLQKHGAYFVDEIKDDKIFYADVKSKTEEDNQSAKEQIQSGGNTGYAQIAFVGLSFRTFDLIRWSYQISCGMQYLASKKLIHRDLAPRNILIKNVSGQELGDVKITDFGLSKKMQKKQYEYTKLVKQNESGLILPWRHLAPELLNEDRMVFSQATDVWSFGVTIWEMFSLGERPYSNFEEYGGAFINAVKFLNLRNPKPRNANTEIYDIMQNCWDSDPNKRPKFTELTKTFLNLLPSEYVSSIPQSVYEPPNFDVTKLEPLLPKPENLEKLKVEQETQILDSNHGCCHFLHHSLPFWSLNIPQLSIPQK